MSTTLRAKEYLALGLLANFFDKLTTYIGISNGHSEANALMNALLTMVGLPLTILFTFILATLSFLMLYLHAIKKQKILPLMSLSIFYAGIVVWNTLIITNYITFITGVLTL